MKGWPLPGRSRVEFDETGEEAGKGFAASCRSDDQTTLSASRRGEEFQLVRAQVPRAGGEPGGEAGRKQIW